MTPPKTPKAAPRSRGGKLTWMTESTCGYMSAAISPWRTRAAISAIGLGASPQMSEAR